MLVVISIASVFFVLLRMISRASKIPKVSPQLRNKILDIEKEYRQAEKEGRAPKFKK